MGSHLPPGPLPTPEMFVEFAHIYADSVFGEEQDSSLKVMKEYLDRESSPGSLVVSAILIDDLHVEAHTLDVVDFVRAILRRGLAPDHVVFEGRLGPIAEKITQALVDNSAELSWEKFRKTGKRVLTLRVQNENIGLKTIWEDGREEWSCAILSSAWSLARAGVFEFPEGSIISLTESPVVGHRIVSVLHRKYSDVERKVQLILEAGRFEDLLPRLELVFFD